MSMDLNLWLANGGVSLDGRKHQTPIVPVGWSARARHLADELDELLHGDLGEVTKQLLTGTTKRPVNFNALGGSKPAPQKGSTGGSAPAGYIAPVGSGQQTTYTGPVATKTGGPVTPGSTPQKGAAVARSTKGGGPVSAVQSQKTYQTGTGSLRQTMKDLTGRDPLAESKQTMVPTYGASDKEKAYVEQYNAEQGNAPVQAGYVESRPPKQDFLSSLIPSLTGGLVQALGGGPASDFVGSLFGAGIGGPGFGTGDLPGALGRMNERYFGTPALPPAFERTGAGQLGLTPYATDSDWQRMAALADHAGSTVARATLGVAVPELQSIRADLERRSVIESMERRFKRRQEERDFRREVLLRLTNLARMVAEHDARVGGGGYGYEERRY